VHEQKAGLDLTLVLAAVDGGRDLVFHVVLPSTKAFAGEQAIAEANPAGIGTPLLRYF
jgi:hypothetical protein